MGNHSSRRLRRAGVSATLAVLTALMTAGCGRSGSAADDETRAVAVQFLDALRAGKIQPAWASSSTEFKSLMGVENLRDYVKTHPALKGAAEFAETRTIDRNGRTLAECVFQATPPPNSKSKGKTKGKGKPRPSTIKVLLAPGAEGWKVEQLVVE